MKITGYRTLSTLHHWGRAIGDVNGTIEQAVTEVPIVILETDAGIEGVGVGSHADLDRLFPAIEGEDPRAVSALFDRMLARVFKSGHAGATYGGIATLDAPADAALDVAAELSPDVPRDATADAPPDASPDVAVDAPEEPAVTPTCAAGEIACGARCVTVDGNPLHCGRCFNACAAATSSTTSTTTTAASASPPPSGTTSSAPSPRSSHPNPLPRPWCFATGGP